MKSMLNKSATRAAIMAEVDRTGRTGVITQIDPAVFEYLEWKLGIVIQNVVHNHPSGFKTLQPGVRKR